MVAKFLTGVIFRVMPRGQIELNVRPSSLSGKEFEHGRLAMEQRIICNLPLEANIGNYSEKFLCGAVEKNQPYPNGRLFRQCLDLYLYKPQHRKSAKLP